MNTLYKGYIKTKGKKAIEAFKDRTKYRTYDEVKNLEGFGGVLADDTSQYLDCIVIQVQIRY